jgi:glycosyltransferase involved in cell wall biosynthesis
VLRQVLMIYLELPVGNKHGWGICGKYLVQELSFLSEALLIRNESELQDLDDIERAAFKEFLINREQLNQVQSDKPLILDSTVLQCIPYSFPSSRHKCWPHLQIKSPFNVGYVFLEESILGAEYKSYLLDHWDLVVAGCHWGETVLKENGLEKVTSIIQGIDPHVFNANYAEKIYLKDKFVIFSGGKFEFRKGQDVVIKAFRILQEKYDDVMLVNSWFNGWPESMAAMSYSPHINFNLNARYKQWTDLVNHILNDNGIDLERVITLPAYSNLMMAKIYQNTDIGLFPNRCEGGTNLVLMEYMACGKPVIASYSSGHRDIINDKNALLVKTLKPLTITEQEKIVAIWDEPNLDEILAHLEWAYHNRDAIKTIGTQAAQDLSQLTWRRTAEQFYALLTHHKLPEKVS